MTKVYILLSLALLLTVQLYSAQAQQDEDVTEEDKENLIEVATPSGKILGKQEETEEGTQYYSFRGIPYAEPPLGQLRFKDPVPKTPWIDGEPLNATEYGNICFQANVLPGAQPFYGSEDCLYLNIWTPRLPSVKGRPQPRSSYLPVFVYIHTGGFLFGSGAYVHPRLLMEREVIFVTMNYRLGPLGFLSLGNTYISGNQGLKDQLLALKWIQGNIHAFGGDGSKVTLMGESAGGSSATLHQMSPLGHGLYRNVIAMSGTGLYRAHGFFSGYSKRQGHKYVNAIGCAREALSEVLSCLETEDVNTLHSVKSESLDFEENYEAAVNGTGPFYWMPTVDQHALVPFLPEHPYLIMAKGQQKDISLMLGFVENEGGGTFGDVPVKHGDILNGNWSFLGSSFLFLTQANELTPAHELVAETMRHFYTGVNTNFTAENQFAWFDFVSDTFYLSNGWKMAQLASSRQTRPVYMYLNKGKPTASITQLLNPEYETEGLGLLHGDDLFLVFGSFADHNGLESEEARATSNKLLTLFTNFAKYDDPTPFQEEGIPVWQPWTSTAENYIELKEEPEMKKGFFSPRMFFWEKMYWEPFASGFRKTTVTPQFQRIEG